jgi:FkbM family methyltransferase
MKLPFNARRPDQTSRYVRKGLIILGRRRFIRAIVGHRVAAATEHLTAIRFCAANTLIDAGANKGQFSLAFRALRPRANIIAFEPLPEAADIYQQLFAGDGLTRLQRVALSSSNGSAQFHVTDRADNSSLLRPRKGHERASGVRGARTIEVPVKRLDDCVDISRLAHPIFLKVDVQGGELGVFEGCDALAEFDFIYAELGFVELYEGQPLFQEVSEYLARRGFAIAGVFDQIITAEFGPTQVDVLFKRIPAKDENPLAST